MTDGNAENQAEGIPMLVCRAGDQSLLGKEESALYTYRRR